MPKLSVFVERLSKNPACTLAHCTVHKNLEDVPDSLTNH